MSAPAQVTEAHKALICRIRANMEPVGHYEDAATCAQLIADSEARALGLALAGITCTHHTDKQRHECPVCLVTRLRAEVAKLTASFTPNGMLARENESMRAEVERLTTRCGKLDRENARLIDCSCIETLARAERAELEVAKLRSFYDQIVAECGHDLIVREYRQRGELLRDEANRRKEAEAELTKERARLDWLLAPCHKRMPDDNRGWKGKPFITRSVYSTCDGAYIGGELVTHREVIDAAMKEDGK